MKLERIQKQSDLLGSAITIQCIRCKDRIRWNEAVDCGWVIDREGNPLLAYYCLCCSKDVEHKD
jgi:hypothetical protein